MSENKKNRQEEELWETIDLLLDGEAEAEGPRLLAAIEDNEQSLMAYRYAQSVDKALQRATQELEPPASLWKGVAARLKKEPLPRPSMLDRLQSFVGVALRLSHHRYAFAGTSFLFLLTCGTLWWDGGTGFSPFPGNTPGIEGPVPPGMNSWSSTPGLALEQSMSDQLEWEASKALETMIYELNQNELTRQDFPGAPTPDGSQP